MKPAKKAKKCSLCGMKRVLGEGGACLLCLQNEFNDALNELISHPLFKEGDEE